MLALGMIYLWFVWSNQLLTFKDRYMMMGTLVEITVTAPRSKDPAALAEGARREIERMENIFSSYKKDSFVSRLNDLPAGTPLRIQPGEESVLDVLDAARRVSEWSDGAFDITFASVGRFWNLDPENPRLPTPEEIAEALPKINYRNVIVDRATSTVLLSEEGTKIGLGGIAKGAIVDSAIRYLREKGAFGALVNAGGDLYVFGKKDRNVSWRLQLQHPRNRSRGLPPEGFVLDKDVSVVTSGDYERFVEINGKRYHHIINPRTGMPATGLMSVTALAPTAMMADALATAFFVMGPEKGLALAERLQNVEALFITEKEEVLCTSGIPEALRNIQLK